VALKFRPAHVLLYSLLIVLPACVRACEPFCTDDNDDVETTNKGGGDLGKSPLEKPGDSSTKPKVKPYPPAAARARAERAAGRAVKLPADKRIAMTGKPGFPFSRVRFDRVDTGPFDARATVAVDPLDPGLTATTRGYLQMNHLRERGRRHGEPRGLQVRLLRADPACFRLPAVTPRRSIRDDVEAEREGMATNGLERADPRAPRREDGR
jgi:hypothetical protein